MSLTSYPCYLIVNASQTMQRPTSLHFLQQSVTTIYKCNTSTHNALVNCSNKQHAMTSHWKEMRKRLVFTPMNYCRCVVIVMMSNTTISMYMYILHNQAFNVLNSPVISISLFQCVQKDFGFARLLQIIRMELLLFEKVTHINKLSGQFYIKLEWLKRNKTCRLYTNT